MVGSCHRRICAADMVRTVLIIAWHIFIFGVGYILGMITEANCEEVNDERTDSTESEDRSSDR